MFNLKIFSILFFLIKFLNYLRANKLILIEKNNFLSIKNVFNRIFMKKLILVRHAKSSWKHDVIDFERPLNTRGIKDAEIVSNYLKNNILNIDLVISSDAVRTKITASTFISNLNIDEKLVNFNHNLYDFSGHNLVKTIKEVDSSINNLMVFGHNHAITDFVNTYGDKYIENVPTCGITIINFDIDNWKDLNNGKTVFTLFPKDLK